MLNYQRITELLQNENFESSLISRHNTTLQLPCIMFMFITSLHGGVYYKLHSRSDYIASASVPSSELLSDGIVSIIILSVTDVNSTTGLRY